MPSRTSQPSLSSCFAPSVLHRFIQTSTVLFQRRMPEQELDALGVESAMPGLEVSDADWDTWLGVASSLR